MSGHPTFVIESVTAVSLLFLVGRTDAGTREPVDGWMDGLPRPPAIPQIQYLLASKTLILPTTATAATVFASLPFQTANKGQIIIDRVE